MKAKPWQSWGRMVKGPTCSCKQRVLAPRRVVVMVRVLHLETPVPTGAEVQGDYHEAHRLEGPEEDGRKIQLDQQVPPDSGHAQQPDELENADGLDGAGEGHPLRVTIVVARAVAAAAVGELEGPVNPAERDACDEVEAEAAWGADVELRHCAHVMDVEPAGKHNADEKVIKEVENKESVDGHVEVEKATAGADVVTVPEGELERDNHHCAYEEEDANSLVVGIEVGGGMDELGALDSSLGLAFLDAEDNPNKVLP